LQGGGLGGAAGLGGRVPAGKVGGPVADANVVFDDLGGHGLAVHLRDADVALTADNVADTEDMIGGGILRQHVAAERVVFPLALDALEQVHNNVTLTIAGDGLDSQTVHQMVRDRNLQHRVFWKGSRLTRSCKTRAASL